MNQRILLKGFKKLKNINYEIEEQNNSYGRFVLYPLEKGVGYTLGNTFRRVLLSSLPGYAICAMRVETYDSEGNSKILPSEFEPIPEVVEETLEVINNLKSVKISLLDDIESKTIRIERKGPGVITAKDLEFDNTLEVYNGDLTIMTLTDKANISMDLQIDSGKGYVSAERQNEYIETLDTIPIDAIYTPIENVSFVVKNARVGQRNDYDKLIFEVWTNGSIKPEDAVAGAAKMLKEHFQLFINFKEESEEEEKDFDDGQIEYKNQFETSVDELELSVRAGNCLRTVNIRTIGDLVSRTEDDISKIRHFGKKSLSEIKEKLANRKLTFGMAEEVGKILRKK